VIYLGANVPADRFAETAQQVKAGLVVLVSQTLNTAAHLQHAAFALDAGNIPVGFGGRIFNLRPGIADHIPGRHLGGSLDDAVTGVESILKFKPEIAAPKSVSQEYHAALQGFNARRIHIESAFKLNMPPISISSEEIDSSIQHLGDNIAASLQFGDMDHLSAEMDWLKTLLQTHNRPRQELIAFMEAYSRAVDSQINGQGEPIKKWLREYA
jgi:hypothetical protein